MAARELQILRRYPWLRDSAIVTSDLRHARFAIPRGEAGWWIDGVTFERVDFSGLDLGGFTAIGSEFVDCDFTQTKLKENVTLGAEELSPRPATGDQ